MFNSAKIFEQAFMPIEGGYLYYPTRWSKGYLVTPAEFEQLKEDWRRFTSFSTLLKAFGILLAAVLVTDGLQAMLFENERSSVWTTVIPASIWIGYALWKYSASYRLIRDREPVRPRRASDEAARAYASRLGWPLAMFVLLLNCWFIFLSILIVLNTPVFGVPLLAFFTWSLILNGKMIWQKWSMRAD